MDTRRLADVQPIPADTRRKPRKNRTALFTALTLGAGAFCGVAALIGIGPFSALHASAHSTVTKQTPVAPVDVKALFPAPSPVTRSVDVYDPPQAPRPTEAKPEPPEHESPSSEAKPTPSPREVEPTPSPRPVEPTPSPSPGPGDE